MSLIVELEEILKENENGILANDQALGELRQLLDKYDKEEQAALENMAKEFNADNKTN